MLTRNQNQNGILRQIPVIQKLVFVHFRTEISIDRSSSFYVIIKIKLNEWPYGHLQTKVDIMYNYLPRIITTTTSTTTAPAAINNTSTDTTCTNDNNNTTTNNKNYVSL